MSLSDHLEMLGVELRATFTQTRKVNGEIILNRVKNTIGPWKAGRFMPLSQRPFSANCYALSKVWFKCCVVNLRVQDINGINSLTKSWLYQDLLLKSSELVLYRNTVDGGLGLHNVKVRASALLIRTFLETAVNPNFIHSLFHEHLYRYHVLKEHSLPDPGFPPYYDKEFFSLIQHYKETSPMNISTMSTKDWYATLLDDQVLLNPTNDDAPASLIPVRPENLNPNCEWPQIWSNVRSKGLGSELSSFLLKLVHGLLPTQDRIARIGMAVDGQAVCLLCRTSSENLLHCFFECPHNMVVGLTLLGYVQHVVPNLSPEAALLLDFQQSLTSEESLAVCVMLSTGLKYIWETRVSKKVVTTFSMRAEIEARVSILRRTRHEPSGLIIEEMLLNNTN